MYQKKKSVNNTKFWNIGSLAYIINPSTKLLSQLYWFLTCFVLCDFWQHFLLHLGHKRYLHLNPGKLLYMAKETLNVRPKLRIFRWGDSLALPRSAKIVITRVPITKYWKCWSSQLSDCRSGEGSWSCNHKCEVHNYPIYEHRWRFYYKKGKVSVAINIENGGRGHEQQMQEMHL